jgi:uncharacterized protein YukE
MTLIRVDPSDLRQRADQLEAAAARLQALADEALELTASAPSHQGEFGPKAQGLGSEAQGALASRANQLSELSTQLRAKAEAFEQADLRGEEAFASLGFSIPPPGIPWPDWGDILPWWLVELVIGLFPFGDAYDILKQLGGLVTQGELDELVLLLSVLGLAADAGWLDGVIPDPVDAANAGLALLKGLVKQIPPGPVRDAIKETIVAMFKNADEGPRFFAALFQLVAHGEVLKVLKENPRAFAAVLEAGSESMEQLAKNEQVALAILKHEDVAVALFKNSQYLDEIIQGGPEAAEQLLKYGDDFAARYLGEIPENGLASVKLLQGMEVSHLAQGLGVDMHVAGRLADTPADITIRELAAKEVQDLLEDGVSPLEAQLRIAEKYDIGFYQARLSSGKQEVDVFIHSSQWDELTPLQKDSARETLAKTFGVEPDEVDFYQELTPKDLSEFGIPEGLYRVPDPATSVPNGAIHFGPDGAIDHPPLGDQQFIQDLEQELMEEFGGP